MNAIVKEHYFCIRDSVIFVGKKLSLWREKNN
jgi:hypothetical protein